MVRILLREQCVFEHAEGSPMFDAGCLVVAHGSVDVTLFAYKLRPGEYARFVWVNGAVSEVRIDE